MRFINLVITLSLSSHQSVGWFVVAFLHLPLSTLNYVEKKAVESNSKDKVNFFFHVNVYDLLSQNYYCSPDIRLLTSQHAIGITPVG